MRNAVVLAVTGFVLLSCATTRPVRPDEGIRLVKAACFEVVAEKVAEDSLSYDRPLDWDALGFAARNEKYIPLGTAFAISATELVTAAHVLNLTARSLVYETRYIREKVTENGRTVERVHEIDEVRAFDDSRDYVVFTVKGRTFDTWLAADESPSFDAAVYTAGDAYGEGIVVREGVLLDTVPEEENGAWSWLKSSIATNPGSSGGPLLNERFDVIGIVLSRKDDFCYSLPIGEISPGTAVVHDRISFTFSVFSTRVPRTLDATWPLPMAYRDLTDAYFERYMAFYRQGMDDLFAQSSGDLFPDGANSGQALFNYVGTSMPQIYLQDSTTGTWFSTSLEASPVDIGGGGSVAAAEIYEDAAVWLMRLDAPDGVTARQLYDDPRLAMDTLLKGIKITRTLTSSDQGSRVTSYGAPIETLAHTDRFGRAWRINVYLLEYTDQVVITCATPTPRGLSLIYVARYTSEKDVWLYDIGKITDFVNISYSGTLAEWGEFLRQPDFRTAAMRDVRVSFTERAALEVDTNGFSCRIPHGVISITPDANLGLYCGVYLRGGEPVYDVRKLAADSGDGNDSYYIVYRWSRPAASLPKAAKDSWQNSVLDRGHPYSGRMYMENGAANIGSVHPAFLVDGKVVVGGDFAYTLFVSKEGSAREEEMAGHLQAFMESTRVKE